MAKKQLTAEEKLQAALVPVEEQPYKVPDNWCWVRLRAMTDILNGYAFKKNNYVESGIRIIRIANVQDGYIVDEKPVYYPYKSEVELEKFLLKENDLLISLTGNVGRVAFLTSDLLPAALNQRVGCIRILNDSILNIRYLFYYLLQRAFQIDCIRNAKGSAQLNMSTEWLKKYTLPVPNELEQSRIVARIESLFAKLDEAKEKIQEVLDGADLRRAAILHQAFTGKLTEKWRTSHTVTCAKDLQTKALVAREGQPESWIRCKIGDYLELKAGKFISAAEINAEISDVTPYECFGGNGIRGYVKNYNTEGTHPLIGRQGALCGNVQVGEGKFYATEHAVVVTYKYDTDTMWIVELLRHMNLNQYSRSVAQPGLAVKNIVELPIVIAPYEEQVEIGRILDNLLSREQSTVTACEEALTTIDTLKKSILAHAFRGELGTNDPSEASAKELLQEILAN